MMEEKLDLQLVKELSTVGELVSLTDRPVRRQSDGRRDSFPTSRSEGTRSRGRRRRSSSAKSASPDNADRIRSVSLSRRSPSRKGSVSLSRHNSLQNVIPTSRRESVSLSRRSSILNSSSEDRESPMKNLKLSRRESMLNVLRGELEKIPCILAIHKRRESPDKEPDDETEADPVFGDSETDDDSNSTYKMKTQPRQARCASSLTPVSALSDAEIRKLQMIKTLNQMGVTPRGYRKNSTVNISGEAAVMEASYAARKRGSISNRVMLVASKRKYNRHTQTPPHQRVTAREVSGSVSSDTEDMTEDQKQKSKKVLDLLKKPEKLKLPGIVGKQASSKEDIAVESMNMFRRKLRRRKVRIVMPPLQFLKWTIPSLNLDTYIVANRYIS